MDNQLLPKQYPLISDKWPFLLIERAKIYSQNKSIVYEREGKKHNLPIRHICCLILGNGVPITSEAIEICSKNRCYIAQSKGGLNIHTMFNSGHYSNPKKIINQVNLTDNPVSRLRIAKYIVSSKLLALLGNTEKVQAKIDCCVDIPTLLGLEGVYTKKAYKKLFGDSFYRNFNTQKDFINMRINLINHILYSFITAVIYSLGYHPSIGFVHGHTRRGALVFDIADLFKYRIYKDHFSELFTTKDQNITRVLSDILCRQKNSLIKEIIEKIVYICEGYV